MWGLLPYRPHTSSQNGSCLGLLDKHWPRGQMPSRARPVTDPTEHECTAAFFTFFHVRTRFTDHFPITDTVWQLSALDSHYEEHRETAPLTWLMKRLLRFSLTVKTKDATEMLLACVPTPCRLLRTGLCVKVPPFHQPTCPDAQLTT